MKAHVGKSFGDSVGAGVRDAGVAAGCFGGFGDVPVGSVRGGGFWEVEVPSDVGDSSLVVRIWTYQCGQRNVASDVTKGVIAAAVRSGVVSSVRTGDVEGACGCEIAEGADVGWLVG